ncbi:hypothetical protein QCA50_010542 [Cerrena zonata]|uniref:Uncharacterized protein n=1 Tax=Cerrena zonata TaxID=2478898 RepID=A0AAW0FXT3_9APHY
MKFFTVATTLFAAFVAVYSYDASDPNSNPFFGDDVSSDTFASNYPGYPTFAGFGTLTMTATTSTSTATPTPTYTFPPYPPGSNLNNPNNVDETDETDDNTDESSDSNGDGYIDYEPYGTRSVKRWMGLLD